MNRKQKRKEHRREVREAKTREILNFINHPVPKGDDMHCLKALNLYRSYLEYGETSTLIRLVENAYKVKLPARDWGKVEKYELADAVYKALYPLNSAIVQLCKFGMETGTLRFWILDWSDPVEFAVNGDKELNDTPGKRFKEYVLVEFKIPKSKKDLRRKILEATTVRGVAELLVFGV
jgi:hypothetical protein